MKHLITMCMALLFLFAVTGYSQNRKATKSSLFAGFPSTINCTESQLNSLFTATQNQHITLALDSNFILSGPVTSKLIKYNNLQTIIIKLSSFKNTLFSLSKQTQQNNNYTYVGRILNPLYADGFELKRNTSGNYQFIKINVEKILLNCNQ